MAELAAQKRSRRGGAAGSQSESETDEPFVRSARGDE